MVNGIKNNKDLVEVYSKEAIDEMIASGDMVGLFSIKSGHLGLEVVQTEHIEDGAVTAEKIGDFAIKNSHLGPEVVDEGNIVEGLLPKMGYYVGTGEDVEQTINIGFKPRLVILLGGTDSNFAIVGRVTDEYIVEEYMGKDTKGYGIYTDVVQNEEGGSDTVLKSIRNSSQLPAFSDTGIIARKNFNISDTAYMYVAFK